METSIPSNKITIKEFSKILENYNTYIINNIVYDNVLYCGNDNLYFSYCFNYMTGKAISEILIITETVIKLSDDSYYIKTPTSESFIFLKDE